MHMNIAQRLPTYYTQITKLKLKCYVVSGGKCCYVVSGGKCCYVLSGGK